MFFCERNVTRVSPHSTRIRQKMANNDLQEEQGQEIRGRAQNLCNTGERPRSRDCEHMPWKHIDKEQQQCDVQLNT